MNVYTNPAKETWTELTTRPSLELDFLESTVKNILNRVKKSGDAALKELTLQLDKVEIKQLAVSKTEIENAVNSLPPELKEAITRMQADAIYARDSLSGPAMVFGYSLTTGSTIDDVEYWTYDIAKVTAQQVQDVAKKYLDPDAVLAHASVTGYLLPKVSAPPAAEAAPEATP